MCRPKHVEELRNIGIINSSTRSHLVGSFYEIYTAMHGSMDIKVVEVAGCWIARSGTEVIMLLLISSLTYFNSWQYLAYEIAMLSTCLFIQRLNQFTGFNVVWKLYPIGSYPHLLLLCNFLQWVNNNLEDQKTLDIGLTNKWEFVYCKISSEDTTRFRPHLSGICFCAYPLSWLCFIFFSVSVH